MTEQLSLLTLEPVTETTPPVVHHCHAKGCEKVVPERMLMCKRHWGMVPKTLQKQVWATYRAGQEVTKDPSPEYLAAAQAAIAAVQKAESSKLPKSTIKQPKTLPAKESTSCQKAPNAWHEWVESGLVIGMVVLVDALAPNDRRPMAVGCITGVSSIGMAIVDIGIPGNPYTCAPERLTNVVMRVTAIASIR